jgi:primosomal protein N' (replication factor Y)
VVPPEGVTPLPLRTWSGWGPPPTVLAAAEWAAWRWAGPVSFFLKAASPSQVVRALPSAPTPTPTPTYAPAPPRAPGPAPVQPTDRIELSEATQLARSALAEAATTPEPVVLRLPPLADLLDVVIEAVGDPAAPPRPGGVLVLVPSVGWAERLCQRLVRRGLAATTDWAQARAGWPIVVGSRAGAWTPLPELAAVVVLDAHDEAYQEERAPTYSAVEVAVHRAHAEGAPCLLVSPCPPATVSHARRTLAAALPTERAGWAALECIDRRGADPRSGLFSDEFVRLSRRALDEPADGPLVCVYNRTGRARILACRKCAHVAQCTICGAAMHQEGEGLRCPRCHGERPLVCAECGHLRFKTLRAGVSRLREEVAALLGVEVGEVSSASGDDALPATPVLMGTEAVLHRVRRAAAVAFLDIDLHVLAARFSATDETLALFVRAARLVGSNRVGPPRLLVQTRVPDHPVLAALRRGDVAGVLTDEVSLRGEAGLPPFTALAALSGSLADEYAEAALAAGMDRGVTGSRLPDERHLISAPDHTVLCDLLESVPRPAGRGLRVEVDPSAV